MEQTRQRLGEAAAELVHRLGKYVSRTARNIPDGEIPSAVVDLFVEDVFETEGATSALELFGELVAASGLPASPRLDRCRALLEGIAAMERDIRIGDDAAIRRAAAMTLEVDAELRALASEIQRT